MALNATLNKKSGPDSNEEMLTLEFTNGTLKQLRELAAFLKSDGFNIPENEAEKLKEVISIGIAWLQSIKERRDKETTITSE